MKLHMTMSINFNIDKKETITSSVLLHDNPGYRDLINQQKLLSKLLILSNNAKKWKTYQLIYKKSILLAVLDFKDLKFRNNYSNWIYFNYSNSVANHRMVHKNESRILFKWAKDFNHHNNNLKLIKIIPRINSNHLYAYLLLIPFTIKDSLSFDLKAALINKYHINSYNNALYKFENDNGNKLSNVAQEVFNQCIPDGHFNFINDDINKNIIPRLKPIKHERPVKHKVVDKNKINISDISDNPSLLNLTPRSVPLLSAPSETGYQSINSSMKETSDSISKYSKSSFSTKASSPASTSSMSSLASENSYLIQYTNHHVTSKSNFQSSDNPSSSTNVPLKSSANIINNIKSSSQSRDSSKKAPAKKTDKRSNVLDTLNKNKGYITLIIVISFIIIALLIIIFPLFKF